MPAGRYFGAFLLIVAILYGLIYFTGTTRTPQLGLDLRGGTTVTLTARTPGGQAPAKEDLELARQIIEQRVNGLGVAEAEVVTEGNSNIVISVPGDNGDQARQLGQTAQLRFRPVVQAPEPVTPAASSSATPTPTDGAAPTSAAATPTGAAASPTGSAGASATPSEGPTPTVAPDAPPVTQEQAPATLATLTCDKTAPGTIDRPGDYVAACDANGKVKYLLGPAILEGTDVTNATAGTRSTTGAWVVNLTLNNSGSDAWATYTAANVGKQVGITLDGRVVSAPTIQGAIPGGKTEISGSFDQTTATELANQLKYGALPLSFKQATAQSISTELGAEQLKAGLIAGAIGIALVFVYALLYYRLLGLVMIASLALSAVVVFATLVPLGRPIGFNPAPARLPGVLLAPR